MAITVSVYTEYLDRNWEWQCDQIPNSQAAFSDRHINLKPAVNRIKDRTADLLAMGLGKRKTPYPFAWGQRGFPLRVSKPVKKQFDNIEARVNTASHINLDELRTKRMELLIVNDKDSPGLSEDLGELIDLFPAHDLEPHFQRMVFWFH